MKKILLVFALFIVVHTQVAAQEKSADTMVHKIFRSLQSNNEKAFVTLFPDYQQWKDFLKEAMVQEAKSSARSGGDSVVKINLDSIVKSYMGELTEASFKEEIQKKFPESFHSIMEEGKAKGMAWSQATLTSYTIDTVHELESNFPTLKGIMDVKDGDKEYQLAFEQIIWFEKESGWFGVDLKKLVRKGESLDDDIEFGMDSLTLTDRTEPPPPPPVKKVQAKKPVNTKTIPKKSSPAVKPKSTITKPKN
jgi:hypothetical protein